MTVAKLLKNTEMSQVWPETFIEGHIHQLQPEPTHKIMKQLQKHPVKDLSPMNISDIMIMKHSPFHFEGKSAETEQNNH